MKLFLSPLFLLTLLFTVNTAVSAAGDQTNQSRTSSDGIYQVTIDSYLKPLRLGRMHAWTAAVKDADGKPVTAARIKIGGGMPIHNHGFPTQPVMTKELEPGKYLLEGFKFSMGGPWVIFLDITAEGKTDSVAFDINM